MIILHMKSPTEFTKKLLRVINELSKITGLKSQDTKIYAVLYISNEIKLKNNTTYNNVQKRKILRDKFNNCVPDLYNESYKAYLSEIKKDLNKLRDKPCSRIRRLNIAKIAVLPKLIHRYNGILTKILGCFFIKNFTS